MHTRSILGWSFTVLSLALWACGSNGADGDGGASPSTGGNASSNPSPSTGGSTSGKGTSSSTSPTAGCDNWPAAKFIPGYPCLFYGTQTGPCRITTVNTTGTAIELLSYDASGLLEKVTRTATTYGVDTHAELTFSWVGGVLQTGTYSTDGVAFATATFEYSPTAIVETYSRANQSPSTHITYTLTPEGYPSTATSINDDATTSSVPATTYYRYEYVNCRLVGGCSGSSAEELKACTFSFIYQYDTEGRITSSTNNHEGSTVYEYTCN